MTARIACSPLAWGETRFERVLDDVADTGYTGVEANQTAVERFARQPARLRGLLVERNLTLCAAPFTGAFHERDERAAELGALRLMADFLGEAGEGGMVVFRTVPHPARRDMIAGQPPILPLSSDRVARLADTLNEYCYRCRDMGLAGAFQNRVGSYIETPEEYVEVIERTEPDLVGLAPDLGHWAYAGGDIDTLVRTYRDRLVYPRLKDVDGAVFQHVCDEHLGFKSFVREGGFTPLGRGTLDLERPLLRLERADYTGWVCVELEPPDLPDPREAAQISREYLRERIHW